MGVLRCGGAAVTAARLNCSIPFFFRISWGIMRCTDLFKIGSSKGGKYGGFKKGSIFLPIFSFASCPLTGISLPLACLGSSSANSQPSDMDD
jgi:hypothetical protein